MRNRFVGQINHSLGFRVRKTLRSFGSRGWRCELTHIWPQELNGLDNKRRSVATAQPHLGRLGKGIFNRRCLDVGVGGSSIDQDVLAFCMRPPPGLINTTMTCMTLIFFSSPPAPNVRLVLD
jgi:hypothetical protein